MNDSYVARLEQALLDAGDAYYGLYQSEIYYGGLERPPLAEWEQMHHEISERRRLAAQLRAE